MSVCLLDSPYAPRLLLLLLLLPLRWWRCGDARVSLSLSASVCLSLPRAFSLTHTHTALTTAMLPYPDVHTIVLLSCGGYPPPPPPAKRVLHRRHLPPLPSHTHSHAHTETTHIAAVPLHRSKTCVVHLATDLMMGEPVALKLMRNLDEFGVT